MYKQKEKWLKQCIGTVMVQKTPGDTDCLVSASVHQLCWDIITQQQHKNFTSEIRKTVANRIRQNIWRFKTTVVVATVSFQYFLKLRHNFLQNGSKTIRTKKAMFWHVLMIVRGIF